MLPRDVHVSTQTHGRPLAVGTPFLCVDVRPGPLLASKTGE